MIKMRRRKGLSEDLSAAKYVDESMLAQMAKLQLDGSLGNQFSLL